jgi:hypothetical protein
MIHGNLQDKWLYIECNMILTIIQDIPRQSKMRERLKGKI